MGVQLTPAEQEAINQRPTQNIQAFLAYSRGLEAEDRGDYGAAQAAYNDAVTLDPSFRAASQGAASASELSTATQQTVGQVEQTVSRTETIQSPAAPSTAENQQSALNNATSAVAPSSGAQTLSENSTQGNQPTTNRNTTPEATGTEGPQPATGTVVIIIKRPS